MQILSQSYDFFLAQRSGYLGNNYPISWRGDSGLTDQSVDGSSLVGGYYDNAGELLIILSRRPAWCRCCSFGTQHQPLLGYCQLQHLHSA